MVNKLLLLKSIFLLCCLPLLPSVGCKGKEPLQVMEPTNSEKILGTWTLAETLHSQNGQFVSVLYDCDLDNTWNFKDGMLTHSQNGTTCDPGSPNGFTRPYELKDNETVLCINFNSACLLKYKIIVLNDSTLHLHEPLNEDVHGEVFGKITYKR